MNSVPYLATFLGVLIVMQPARAQSPEPQFAHMVFFALTEDSDAARDRMIAECRTYLARHDGTVHFSVGTRAREMTRDVNDTQHDIALHLVFESKAAYDVYATHPRHVEFIERNRATWAGVRVFDAVLAAPAPPREAGAPAGG